MKMVQAKKNSGRFQTKHVSEVMVNVNDLYLYNS